MSNLLKKTINNLETNGITEICNVIIVDDMSDEKIDEVAKNHSYLKVEKEKV